MAKTTKVNNWARLPDALQRRILGGVDLRKHAPAVGPDYKQRYTMTAGPDGRKVRHLWKQREALLAVGKAFARSVYLARADVLQAALDAHRAAFEAWAKRLLAGEAAPFPAPPVPGTVKEWRSSCDYEAPATYSPWSAYSWFVELREASGARRYLGASGQAFDDIGPSGLRDTSLAPKHAACAGTGVRYEGAEGAVIQHERCCSCGRGGFNVLLEQVSKLRAAAAKLEATANL
jgi:hypothetical protein